MDHHLVRIAHLGTDGGPQSEAHGAEAAAGEQLAGVVEVEMLDRPHLMLAHIGGHDGVLGGHAADGLQHLPGSEDLGGLHLRLPLQGKDLLLPGVPVVLGDPLVEQFQHPFGGADDVVVGEDIFINLSAININMYDFGVGSKMTR